MQGKTKDCPGEKANIYKQQEDNPTKRQINAFNLPVHGRKTKAEGYTPHQTHDWHKTKAVVGTRFSNKRFYEGNFYFCLSVEKYYQNHSLRTLLNTKLKATHSYAELPLACLLKNEVVFLYPNNHKTIELNDDAFFL